MNNQQLAPMWSVLSLIVIAFGLGNLYRKFFLVPDKVSYAILVVGFIVGIIVLQGSGNKIVKGVAIIAILMPIFFMFNAVVSFFLSSSSILPF